MPLTLTLEGGSVPQTRTLDRGTLSIGRAPGNDWVLADPERLLSKTHCVIAASAGRYVLTDLSTNGVFVNGARERIPRGGQVDLADGDELRLGDYVIRVSEGAPAAEPLLGHVAPVPGGVAHADPLADPAIPTPDPLADPFDAPAPAGFVHPIAAPPPALRAQDPFDLAEEGRPGAPPLDPEDDLLRGIAPVESWQGPSQADNADAPLHVFAAPKPLAPASFDELDIDALLGDEPPGAAPPAPPPPVAPTVQPAPLAAVPAVQPLPPPVQPPADARRLLDAFLAGAGVPDLAVGPDPEAALRAAGEVFRAMVEGIREVLISRAAIKNEFRVEQTMLRARDNSPLKFSVTAEDALAALLGPARPGYKPAVAAAREAFADVRSHEMAVMAGVQTALMSLLRRFEPAALEKRLEPGLLGNILPAARKARTWELFCATYKEIAREAEDDFQAVFGREFARAYDAQMQKL
jgi:type VI secretion system protein